MDDLSDKIVWYLIGVVRLLYGVAEKLVFKRHHLPFAGYAVIDNDRISYLAILQRIVEPSGKLMNRAEECELGAVGHRLVIIRIRRHHVIDINVVEDDSLAHKLDVILVPCVCVVLAARRELL